MTPRLLAVDTSALTGRPKIIDRSADVRDTSAQLKIFGCNINVYMSLYIMNIKQMGTDIFRQHIAGEVSTCGAGK